MSLVTALAKVPQLQLQAKTSKSEKSKQRQNQYRKAKEAIESKWAKTSVSYKVLLFTISIFKLRGLEWGYKLPILVCNNRVPILV